jgi:hypothetical protein
VVGFLTLKWSVFHLKKTGAQKVESFGDGPAAQAWRHSVLISWKASSKEYKEEDSASQHE